jgi:uncharacterized protein YjaG (DUF416 family)
MDDKAILGHIHDLVDEEHALRAKVQAGQISTDEEHSRLRAIEEELDQYWDLLRRRRAARAAGTDPDLVPDPRPVAQVEEYLQ